MRVQKQTTPAPCTRGGRWRTRVPGAPMSPSSREITDFGRVRRASTGTFARLRGRVDEGILSYPYSGRQNYRQAFAANDSSLPNACVNRRGCTDVYGRCLRMKHETKKEDCRLGRQKERIPLKNSVLNNDETRYCKRVIRIRRARVVVTRRGVRRPKKTVSCSTCNIIL